MFYSRNLLKKCLTIISVGIFTIIPFFNAQAHRRGFGRGMAMGMGAGVGYGIARYGMHRILGNGYHHHYYNGYHYRYNNAPTAYAPMYPYYRGYDYNDSNETVSSSYPSQTNITIVQAPPPQLPPSNPPNYPYPVPGYTYYQPGNGYTTEPRTTYVPGYGNVPVSSPITP